MQKLKDINIFASHNGETIKFNTPVNVSKEGLFTTTLPEDIVKKLKSYGADFASNRSGREGFFASETLKGLEKEIEAFTKNAITREVISDQLVIKYEIITQASYVRDTDGKILPNGRWVKNKEDFNKTAGWVQGNQSFGSRACTPMLSVFATVLRKIEYRYGNGTEKTEYERYSSESRKDGTDFDSSIDWLADQCGVCAQRQSYRYDEVNKLPEVPATEDNAQFFVTLLKFIYKANELLKNFEHPENVLAFIKTNKTLQIK